MSVRNIVRIDEEKCTGCGQCVTACAEGAIKIINGKARLVSESYCDGLGACLGHCPEGAITIDQREAVEFDEEATKAHLTAEPSPCPAFICPGLASHDYRAARPVEDTTDVASPSQLTQWPVQLKLVSPNASYFVGADLLLVADCVPFAMGDFHRRFLKGHGVAVGCPKLDDAQFYIGKLSQIVRSANLHSLTVIHMEVPCCSGLTYIAREAILAAGTPMHFDDVTISIRGDVIRSRTVHVDRTVETEAVDHA